ncbi:MAG: LptF/LptG family permease [Flavobacteriales bacterium]
MKKLSVLLLKSYVGPFIVTLMIAMFIFEMQFIWVYLDEMMGKGLGVWIILKLLFFASARVVNMALPLAILMSSIMTMGALAENNELTAMKSSGTSLLRILRPLIFFSVGLSITAFVFANNLWPVANLKFKTILYNVMKQKPSLSLTNGVFYNGIDGIAIRAMQNNPETGELKDVLIYDHRGGQRGNRTVIRAESGLMEQTSDKRYLILTLFNGNTYDEQKEKKKKKLTYPNLHGSFEKNVLRIDLSSLAFSADNEEMMKKPEELMTIPQLDEAIDSLSHTLDTIQNRNANIILKPLHLRRNEDRLLVVEKPLYDQLRDTDKKKALKAAMDQSRKMKESVSRQFDEYKNLKRRVSRHKIEWHRKFFLAVVCLVLFFVGAPLGAIIRKGGLGMPTLIALLIFIVYQLLTMAGENMAKNGIVEPWIGMWISTVVFLPLSFWITWKATREATLLDRDAYIRRFNRIFEFLRLRKKPVV